MSEKNICTLPLPQNLFPLIQANRLSLLFLGFLLSFSLQGQVTITGKVIEKGTGLPLPFANVFINNSTLGAASDDEGNFRIYGNIPDEFELVASFVGYKTISKTIQRKGRQAVYQSFDLEFIEDQLSEVALKAKRDKSWERNIRMFKDVFLAVPDDPYGRDIEILNPWVLDFESVKPEKGFKYTQATAQQALQVVNKALGYQIDFHLQDFRMLRNASRFFGQAYYKNLAPSDSTTGEQWKTNRELNYQNSTRHLMLSILLRNAERQGFELYLTKTESDFRVRTNDFTVELNESIIPLKLDSIYSRPLGNGSYRIFLPGRIEVHHLSKPWPNDYYTNIYHAISWMIAPGGYVDVDRNGTLLYPAQLVLSGYMGRQRMARSLPLDFVPDEGFAGFVEELKLFQARYKTLNALREKPWITLNKPYFHPGENLWLGGRILYQNPIAQDSLSRVVYVEIWNDKLKQVHSAQFPIQEGLISGGIQLADSLPVGDYILRAYTRWGLNFPEKDRFEIPFPIIPEDQQVVFSENVEEDEFGDLVLNTRYEIQDSLNFRKALIHLSLADSYDNPVEADFHLSVLSGFVAPELSQALRLEKALDWKDEPLPDTFDSNLPFSIDYGISVAGRFSPDRKKDSKAQVITLVKGDLEDFGQVRSDSSGYFWATGLTGQDSITLAIAALDSKQQSLGSVSLIPFSSPIFRGSFPRIPFQTQSISDVRERLIDLEGDFVQLEEFVKEETREELKPDRNYAYGDPNQEVGEADLETKTWAEILGLLRFDLNTLKFRNYTFGEETGSPLLIIDGNSRPFLEKEEFREILLGFDPSQLKSIKVYYDNISNSAYGMAGYAGVMIIETKNGFRTGPEEGRKFNPAEFDVFSIPGFSSFKEFPIIPPKDQLLKNKPTLYWNPKAITEKGSFDFEVYVPLEVKKLWIKIEGLSEDGDPVYKLIPIEIGK